MLWILVTARLRQHRQKGTASQQDRSFERVEGERLTASLKIQLGIDSYRFHQAN
jgi:hypothetical protein